MLVAVRYGAGVSSTLLILGTLLYLLRGLSPHVGGAPERAETELIALIAVPGIVATALFWLGGQVFRAPLTVDAAFATGVGSILLQLLLLVFFLATQSFWPKLLQDSFLAFALLLSTVYFFAPLLWRSRG